MLNGLDMKDREDVPTAKAFLRDLDDFLLRYRYNESVASFDDVIHRTYIFLQAISGEALDIRVDEKDRAWTDTNALYSALRAGGACRMRPPTASSTR